MLLIKIPKKIRYNISNLYEIKQYILNNKLLYSFQSFYKIFIFLEFNYLIKLFFFIFINFIINISF